MNEESLLSLLSDQQEKSRKLYHELFSSLSLSRLDHYDSLPETADSSYNVLHTAGFIPGSIIDRLTETSLKLLIQLAKEDTSRIFLEDDIRQVAQQYGLKFLKTKYYKGKQKEMFVNDLNVFQKRIVEITDNPYWATDSFSFRYLLLGASRAFDNESGSKFKAPLLFYYIGEDIYYLVSSHDSWVNKARKVIYWPVAGPKHTGLTWAFLFIFFVSIMIVTDSWFIFMGAFLLHIVFTYFSLEKLFWKSADSFPIPIWGKKIISKIIPA